MQFYLGRIKIIIIVIITIIIIKEKKSDPIKLKLMLISFFRSLNLLYFTSFSVQC